MKTIFAVTLLAAMLWPTSESVECLQLTEAEVGQSVCCCLTQYNQQCCAYVYKCPGPIPGCPCAY